MDSLTHVVTTTSRQDFEGHNQTIISNAHSSDVSLDSHRLRYAEVDQQDNAPAYPQIVPIAGLLAVVATVSLVIAVFFLLKRFLEHKVFHIRLSIGKGEMWADLMGETAFSGEEAEASNIKNYTCLYKEDENSEKSNAELKLAESMKESVDMFKSALSRLTSSARHLCHRRRSSDPGIHVQRVIENSELDKLSTMSLFASSNVVLTPQPEVAISANHEKKLIESDGNEPTNGQECSHIAGDFRCQSSSSEVERAVVKLFPSSDKEEIQTKMAVAKQMTSRKKRSMSQADLFWHPAPTWEDCRVSRTSECITDQDEIFGLPGEVNTRLVVDKTEQKCISAYCFGNGWMKVASLNPKAVETWFNEQELLHLKALSSINQD